MKNADSRLRRLVGILTLVILGMAWGLVGLAVLLGAWSERKGNLLVIAVFASPVALFLCAVAFDKVRFADRRSSWLTPKPFRRSVNIDGTPMLNGRIDVRGRTYGVTSGKRWD